MNDQGKDSPKEDNAASPARKKVLFWRGNISGTNRGRIAIRAVLRDSDVRATAWLDDQMAGPTCIQMAGVVDGRKMDLRIAGSTGLVPLTPLDGGVRITFDQDMKKGEGEWNTDVGTSGACRLVDDGRMAWWWRTLTVPVRHAAVRLRGLAYTMLLLGVAGLSLVGSIELTWQSMLLLLTPAPFVFQAQLLGLIAALKIRRIGPVELQEQNAPTESIAKAVSERVQLEVSFQLLDVFFVLRTKLLLILLAATKNVDRSQFKVIAGQVGVPPDNIDTTLEAIVSTGCAVADEVRVAITDFGLRYVGHLSPAPRT